VGRRGGELVGVSGSAITDADDIETEGLSRRQIVTRLVATLVVLALGAGLLWWWLVRPPYGADAMAAKATVEVVTAETERAALTRLGGGADIDQLYLDAEPGRQLVVGQVTWTVPGGAPDQGKLALLLIHKPTNSVVPTMFGTGPKADQVASGWDAALAAAGKEYDWLSAVGTGQAESELTAPGDAILTRPDTPGPITFVAQLRPDVTQVNQDDLLVALVFVGPRGQVYWAQRLAG
jgi:hypothetical protein